MKFIFLDIDGVLNHREWWKQQKSMPTLEVGEPPELIEWIDPLTVARMNRITESTGAQIVVSSTWRRNWRSIREMAEAFDRAGFTGDVVGWTDFDTNGKGRGDLIRSWMKDNSLSITDVWIIDDTSFDITGPDLRSRFSVIDSNVGLTDPITERIIRELSD